MSELRGRSCSGYTTRSLLFVPICYFFVILHSLSPNPSRPILFTTSMFVMFVFQSDILLEITWTYGYTDTL